MKKSHKCTYVLFAILLFLYVLTFGFDMGLGKVVGSSMAPSLINGDLCLFMGKLSIDRFDIVDIAYKDYFLVKRVVGLPGEFIFIDEGFLYVNGRKVEEYYVVLPDFYGKHFAHLGEDEYFVMGDNRINSNDSRYFGPVKGKDILRKLIFKVGMFR